MAEFDTNFGLALFESSSFTMLATLAMLMVFGIAIVWLRTRQPSSNKSNGACKMALAVSIAGIVITVALAFLP